MLQHRPLEKTFLNQYNCTSHDCVCDTCDLPRPTVTSVECLLMILILSEKPFFFTIRKAASAMGLKTYWMRNKSQLKWCFKINSSIEHLFLYSIILSLKVNSKRYLIDLPMVCGFQQTHAHLYSVAVVSPSCDSHHGQQSCSSANVQNNDFLTPCLHSAHSSPDALVVFLILEGRQTEVKIHQWFPTWGTRPTDKMHEGYFRGTPRAENHRNIQGKYKLYVVSVISCQRKHGHTHPIVIVQHISIAGPEKQTGDHNLIRYGRGNTA